MKVHTVFTTSLWAVALLLTVLCVGWVAGAATVETITEDAPAPWFTYSPASPKPGELITFDASASVGKGGILSYQWDTTADGFHDRAGSLIRKTFDEPGDYPVTLTVHDGLGRVAKLTRTVRVGGTGDVQLTIDSSPTGLTVYIDGERVGVTPLDIDVAGGERHLRLRHYWLNDWETILDLRNVTVFSLWLELDAHP